VFDKHVNISYILIFASNGYCWRDMFKAVKLSQIHSKCFKTELSQKVRIKTKNKKALFIKNLTILN
jgi:hypothetical protein